MQSLNQSVPKIPSIKSIKKYKKPNSILSCKNLYFPNILVKSGTINFFFLLLVFGLPLPKENLLFLSFALFLRENGIFLNLSNLLPLAFIRYVSRIPFLYVVVILSVVVLYVLICQKVFILYLNLFYFYEPLVQKNYAWTHVFVNRYY